MLSRRTLQVINWRLAFYLLCSGLLVLLIVREHSALALSLRTVWRVSPGFILGGFAVIVLSVMASSLLYGALSPRPLRYRRTLLVQLGGMGVNRLLPAGSGAVGIAYLYLRANRVGKAAAAAVVTANNLLGFVGHGLLLAAVLLGYPRVVNEFNGVSGDNFERLLWVAIGLGMLLVVLVLLGRGHGSRWLRPLRPLVDRPQRLVMALGCSLLITGCYVVAVMVAASSLHISLSPAVALIVLSFGVAAASVIPTPGGIGAAEAGIFAALRAYGVGSDDALTVAILYRVMTFWLPLLVGGICFVAVQRRQLLRPKA